MAKINWDQPDRRSPTAPFNGAVMAPRPSAEPSPPKLPAPEPLPAPRPRGPMGEIATEAAREAQSRAWAAERAERLQTREERAAIIRRKLETAPPSLNAAFRAKARGRD